MDSVKIKLVDDLGLYPSIPRVLYKTIQRSIIREYEADTVYLLAKELAYDVVTGQTDKLTAALAKTSGKDFVQFAKTLGISHSDIDGKVCKTKPKSGAADNFGKYGAKSDIATDSTTTLCAGEGHTSGGTGPQYLRDFVEKTLKEDGNGNWPTSTAKAHDKKPTPETNDNARAVAGDLTKLTPEEKTIVAGLLARTIEGGEVIEIRAVSSTSVMVNACYDLLSEGLGVVPYACVGLGGNFVGVVDGRITPKLAYRLKAGLSYQLSPEISAFVGGFYHCVVGAVSSRRY
ncbi:surface antigen family protein [Anaplasma phagocytophilum str. ApNP]|uniref:Surface antigen family protein n=2 Tax=Anaplasma phagocytophilum TaxID=948 RepID=A0A0F3NLT8_ANAPH|nr:surface antigen family protein [Anaplasma phagocytophilum str. ApMUC09]KJV67859.1 surface antigen family protein [Anaplasma phagocytophilum str. ApNP]